ncbi:tannase/feruloyl esterase family alpha/beta hydrolase [Sphingobium sp. HBC34]|uniref:Tannase/feruloyl esterase family alpha/beta hydrolase n=1 Tax=Sphingobium cyanobacteriorum TaxID=3063954 RepID=A0ABT8ZM60_9SPHN|nr:tannase/feruloyl esterase family alpha/beta hydrolase [Sphingobium sp. HBC34]MDO7835624.1 tannase/feruloyl esterase family alpha/beta hydrolase [Sphingobium sp. HBC34]
MTRHWFTASALAPVIAASVPAFAATPAPPVAADDGRCAAFATIMRGHWPDASTRVTSADFVPQGPASRPDPRGFQYDAITPLRAHCAMRAVMAERKGVDGQRYAITFHLRLPLDWNGRFLFQGGGGTNGDVGNALGATAGAGLFTPALAQGYAVVSQDSGHDNAVNSDPAKGGAVAFGFDPEARRNYAYASLGAVTAAAKAAITRFYGHAPRYSYFAGCSKGGQEGLALAHRYPDAFDGIVAAAPGMSLPRAGLAQTWDAQIFGRLIHPDASGARPFARLSSLYTTAELGLIRRAVLKACDGRDGLVDGLVMRIGQCTHAAVLPVLRALTCKGDRNGQCLSRAQIDALAQSLSGPRTRDGSPLYASFPWDGGIGAPGWAVWKLGLAKEGVPALNILIGGAALPTIFQTPPTVASTDPQHLLQWQMAYDFDADAAAIYRTVAPFTESGWTMLSARSPDIDAFRAAGGKLIVPHGAADPVFSLNDTLQWYREMDARYHGAAADSARVFPVPGMNHCEGGPATDRHDAFAALVAWVEQGRAPDRLHGVASAASPWPGRTRPICKYPQYARYKGRGDIEKEESFQCAG